MSRTRCLYEHRRVIVSHRRHRNSVRINNQQAELGIELASWALVVRRVLSVHFNREHAVACKVGLGLAIIERLGVAGHRRSAATYQPGRSSAPFDLPSTLGLELPKRVTLPAVAKPAHRELLSTIDGSVDGSRS